MSPLWDGLQSTGLWRSSVANRVSRKRFGTSRVTEPKARAARHGTSILHWTTSRRKSSNITSAYPTVRHSSRLKWCATPFRESAASTRPCSKLLTVRTRCSGNVWEKTVQWRPIVPVWWQETTLRRSSSRSTSVRTWLCRNLLPISSRSSPHTSQRKPDCITGRYGRNVCG